MREGSKLIVANGSGSFTCIFLSWIGATDKMNCLSRFGGQIVVDQKDVLEFFV